MKLIQSTSVYRGKVFDVHQDIIQLPDGDQHQIDLIQHHPAVTMAPVDAQGQIWFVRQYRHPANNYLLELPAGVMDPGEAPEVSALRELREEIGMAAKSLELIGGFYLAPGYSTEYMHVFLVTELFPSPLPGDPDERIEIVKIPINQVNRLIENREIQDAKSLSALFLAQKRLAFWKDNHA